LVLRAQLGTSDLTASPAIVTAIIAAPTLRVAAMVRTPMVAVIVMPVVTRRDIYHRLVARRGLIHNHRRASYDRRRTICHRGRARRRINRDRTWGVEDWHGQPKIEADRNSCLGGAGQSDCGYHCYQSEQMFCFHGRSDETPSGIFDSKPLIKPEHY
jgi:hypothetical protein